MKKLLTVRCGVGIPCLPLLLAGVLSLAGCGGDDANPDCDPGYTGPNCDQCEEGFHKNTEGACVPDEHCEPYSCSYHGQCDDSSGEVVCTCDTGYDGTHCDRCAPGYSQDHTGACVPDTGCNPDTCSGHGTCDDSSGAPVCTCDPGYAGTYCDRCDAGYMDNGQGVCVPSAECRADSCNYHGICDDSSGQVVCTCQAAYTGPYCGSCADGYRDDGRGKCVPVETCQAGSCSGHGSCDDSTGAIVCTCDAGYGGERCDRCAAGYHEEAGTCVADTGCLPGTCNHHGSCDDSGGEPVCTCEAGYAGDHCDQCAAGYHEVEPGKCEPDEHCRPDSCSNHGTCDDTSGEIVCHCNTGYTGAACDACAAGYHDDGSGRCVADEQCKPDTCNNHGVCNDSSGSIQCSCNPGYAGDRCERCAAGYHDDGAGRCVADESCLPNSCNNHGVCDDSGGVVSCSCDPGYGGDHCDVCAAGYHDDGQGNCVANAQCQPDSCSGHGSCDDSSGQPECTCDPGYTGPRCASCAAGYHDDGAGRCVPNEQCTPDSCNGHGTCDDASGSVVCTCQAGYTGPRCGQCAAGYHDDGAGNCVADQACGPTTCNGHGSCDDSSGQPVCTCHTGYTGAFCDQCAAGYHDDGTGNCVPDAQCQPDSCSGHGTCDDSSGSIVCTCDAGYAGNACQHCAAGYHDDGQGNCVADTGCQANTCNGHGTCDDSSGHPVCTCDPGYAGTYCDQCAQGHHDDGSGGCVADQQCAPDSCNGHGSCDDSSGSIVCSCHSGYTGPRCAQCAAGYHDDGQGNCVPDAQCEPNSCNGHGTCDDSSGQIECTCDPGYVGAHCDSCDAGYHDDGAGNCVPDEQCGPDSCSGHGACDDSSGEVVCDCDPGYDGDACQHCAAGYHDDGQECVPDTQCQPNSCNHHGTCDDSSGQIECTCDPGYAGTFCDSCAQGYHDDGSGQCVADEQCGPGSCSNHGSCDDSSGEVVCTCHTGYTGDHCQDCAAGYHDDGQGNCVADSGCGPDTCNGHGTCDDSSGQPVCTCDAGYTGAHCDACAAGYHNDGQGNCVPDAQCAPDSCSGHGTCDDSSGSIVCSCDTGYAGAACSQCAPGYHDDGQGNCVADTGCGPDTCNGHGSCDDSSGQPVCTCAEGYIGEHCEECAVGYHDDGTGDCIPNRETACADNLDNDEDGLVDCEDWDDCAGDPNCPQCNPQEALACDDFIQGDTYSSLNVMDNYNCSGWWSSGPEYVYTFQAPQDTSVRMQLGDLVADLDVYVLDTECDPQSCIAFGDMEASFWATAGVTYYVVVDGYLGNISSYSLLAQCDLSGEEICDNGIDDNFDGTTDCDDPACVGDPACVDDEICYDGVDNNGDGLTDCDDPLCQGDPACPDCAPIGTLACGDTINASNFGMSNIIDEYSCVWWLEDGPEVVYEFMVQRERDVTVSLTDMTEDMDVFVLDGACDASACLEFGDTSATFTAFPGVVYHIAVDGFWGVESQFTLEVACQEWETGFCDDGIDNDEDGETDCADPDCYGDPACMGCTPVAIVDCNTSVGFSTVGQPTAIDEYQACSHWDARGPEVAFELNSLEEQEITVRFTDQQADLDLYMLSGACSPDACFVSGDTEVSFTAFQNERLYIVVDGYQGAEGEFTLDIACEAAGEECAAGYQDNDGDGVCKPACEIAPVDCAEHEHCDDSSGTAECVCDPGYVENQQGVCEQDPNATGEGCDSVAPIGPGEGTVWDDNTNAGNDGSSACGGSGPDVVYGFSLDVETLVYFAYWLDGGVMSIRTVCEDPASELDRTCVVSNNGLAEMAVIMEPGTYYLWADCDWGGASYALDYIFRPDPCQPNPCPATYECTPNEDWSGYTCECPEGTYEQDGQCVNDPCDPNPCTEPHKRQCVDNGDGTHSCACDEGYQDDGSGDCVAQDGANQWTVMVFLNGDNDLDAAGSIDVDEMVGVGSDANLHIIVLWDTNDGPGRVVRITQEGPVELEDWGETDMSNPKTLKDFGIWCIDNYPADHYALIMWNHGEGWRHESRIHRSDPFKSFSNDCQNLDPETECDWSNEISISKGEVADALGEIMSVAGRKLDLVGFDACLMGTWEVANAVSDYADYLVASSEWEPGTGWPYDVWLPQLKNNPGMSAEALGTAIVDAYHGDDAGNWTLAVTRLDTINALNDRVTAFADALMTYPEKYSEVEAVRLKAQKFAQNVGFPENEVDHRRDLAHFAELVAAMPDCPGDLAQKANELKDQIVNNSVINHKSNGADYDDSYGLYAYIPTCTGDLIGAYENSGSVWCDRTNWEEFVKDFITSDCVVAQQCEASDQITCGQTLNGTNEGEAHNMTSYSCNAKDAGAPEFVAKFDPEKGALVTATLEASGADLDVYVLWDPCDSQNCLAFGDSDGGSESTEFVVDGGDTYYIVVDGPTGNTGQFSLTLDCVEEICDDEIDNDMDGLIDCQDPDCEGESGCGTEECGDEIDNDGDGKTDCWDTDCQGDSTCEVCESSEEVQCGETVSGDTSGGQNNIDVYTSCSGWNESGSEKIYAFTPSEPGHVSVEFTEVEEGMDLDIFILENTCSPTTCKEAGTQEAYFGTDPGVDYYIVIDGYNGDAGSFTFTIECL